MYSWTSYQLGIFKRLFYELEQQCFELEKNEKILALRAAQQHRNQAKQFHENANTLQELLNLQSLHSGAIILPAYITAMQTQ